VPAALTISIAELLVAVETRLVATQRYLDPLIGEDTPVMFRVAVVTPE
jgi:hypothetical protein